MYVREILTLVTVINFLHCCGALDSLFLLALVEENEKIEVISQRSCVKKLL